MSKTCSNTIDGVNVTREQCLGTSSDTNTFKTWQALWEQPNNPCATFYNQDVYSGTGGDPVNQQALECSKTDFIEIFDRYIKTYNHKIVDSGQEGFTSMQNYILDACTKLPGSCTPATKKYVGGLTREQIAGSTEWLNFYGCVAPPSSVSQIAGALTNYPECDPLCNRIGNIKLATDDGKLLECTRAVCVIDDITINAVESSGENINFNQVCNACGTNNTGCTCIISGVNINELWSQIGDANFNQDCGNGSLCLNIESPGQPPVPVTCASSITSNTNNNQEEVNIIWVTVGIIVALIVLGLFIYLMYREYSKSKK